jgi:hypothetical protein
VRRKVRETGLGEKNRFRVLFISGSPALFARISAGEECDGAKEAFREQGSYIGTAA